MVSSLAYAVPETQTGPPLSAHGEPGARACRHPGGRVAESRPGRRFYELLIMVIRSFQAPQVSRLNKKKTFIQSFD
jgi:hypothetical protein